MRYEFQTGQTFLHSASTNDWDANWVVVRMAAADGLRRWSSTNPAFLTWDLQRLVNWLRAVTDQALDVPDVYTSLEPNLQLENRPAEGGMRLRAVFSQEFTPPNGNPWIDYTPDAEVVHRFADTLHTALASFPIRIVEENGPALVYQRQLTLGATRWRPNA
jgi:hypothetical protein